MAWSNEFSAQDEADLMAVVGDQAIYYVGATPSIINVVFDLGNNDFRLQDAYLSTTIAIIKALKADVPNVKKGSKFVIGGVDYFVDAILGESNNMITLSVTHG
jgi:hypothetical protein